MESTVYNVKGKEVGKIKLPESVFGVKWNGDMVHQALVSALSSRRGNTAHTKDRSDVAGGGKKPWKQKGTGRARHGSIRSPIWVGGGVTHGPTNETNYNRKINKKMKAKALFAVLSKKLNDGEVVFVDSLNFEKPKTSEAREVLKNLSALKGFGGLLSKRENATLVSLAGHEPSTHKSFRNFSNVAVTTTGGLSLLDLLNHKFLVISEPESAVKTLFSKLKSKLPAKK